VPDTVEPGADPDVLAGAVLRTARAGADQQRAGVGGLPAHLDDPPGRLGGRPDGVQRAQQVIGQERRGEQVRDVTRARRRPATDLPPLHHASDGI
jgi:hypothetical protein